MFGGLDPPPREESPLDPADRIPKADGPIARRRGDQPAIRRHHHLINGIGVPPQDLGTPGFEIPNPDGLVDTDGNHSPPIGEEIQTRNQGQPSGFKRMTAQDLLWPPPVEGVKFDPPVVRRDSQPCRPRIKDRNIIPARGAQIDEFRSVSGCRIPSLNHSTKAFALTTEYGQDHRASVRSEGQVGDPSLHGQPPQLHPSPGFEHHNFGVGGIQIKPGKRHP